MVKLVQPQENVIQSRAQIGAGAAQAPGLAQAQAGRSVEQLGQQYFQEARQADQTITYSNAMTQATEEYTLRSKERMSRPTDENGVPNYSSLVEDVGAIGQEIKNSIGATIIDPEVRRRFELEFNRFDSNQRIQAFSAARKHQINYGRASLHQNLDKRIEAAVEVNPDQLAFYEDQTRKELATALNSGLISKLTHDSLADNFRKQVRVNSWRGQLESDLEGTLKQLSDNKASALGLKLTEQNKLISEGQRLLRARQKAENDRIKMVRQETEAAFDQANDFIKEGTAIPDKVYDYLDQASQEEPALRDDFDKLRLQQELSLSLAQGSQAERQGALEAMRAEGITTAEEAQTFDILSELHQNLIKMEEDDPIGLLKRQGALEQLPEFDVNAELLPQLSARSTAIQLAKARYGKITHGLSKQEVEQLSLSMLDLSAQEKAQKLAEIRGGLGLLSSEALLADLKMAGNDTVAFAGMLSLDGADVVSSEILQGLDLAKSKDVPSPTVKTFGEAMDGQNLPNYFITEQRRDIYSAARLLYTKRAFEAGHTDPSSVDEDILEKVISDLTNGGPIEYNDSLVEPPAPGIDEDAFEDWLSSISDEEIVAMGGVQGTNRPVSEILEDANLQNIGRGKYLVHPNNPEDPSVLLSGQGDLFVLDYAALQRHRSSYIAPQERTPSTADQTAAPAVRPDLLLRDVFEQAKSSEFLNAFLQRWNAEQDVQGMTPDELDLLDELTSASPELSPANLMLIRDLILADPTKFEGFF